jgi:hypothetical protein
MNNGWAYRKKSETLISEPMLRAREGEFSETKPVGGTCLWTMCNPAATVGSVLRHGASSAQWRDGSADLLPRH